MVAVAGAPYIRTLWTYYHLLQQREKVDGIRARGAALYGASLNTMSYHEPKKLGEEHQRFLAAAGMLPVPEDPDVARARHLELIRDVAKVDQVEGWT